MFQEQLESTALEPKRIRQKDGLPESIDDVCRDLATLEMELETLMRGFPASRTRPTMDLLLDCAGKLVVIKRRYCMLVE